MKSKDEMAKKLKKVQEEAYLQGRLEEKIKSIGKTRTHHSTPEAVESVIAKFNKKHGTEFSNLRD